MTDVTFTVKFKGKGRRVGAARELRAHLLRTFNDDGSIEEIVIDTDASGPMESRLVAVHVDDDATLDYARRMDADRAEMLYVLEELHQEGPSPRTMVLARAALARAKMLDENGNPNTGPESSLLEFGRAMMREGRSDAERKPDASS